MSRSALVVGINQYLTNALRLPAIDADAIAQILEQQGEFHVKRLREAKNKETQQLMVSREKPVNLTDLETALIEHFTPNSAQQPDVALFYFAGHGILKQSGMLNDAYLVTSDANANNVWGLSLDWLRRLLQASPIKTKIVWLDCCHSGALVDFKEVSFKTDDNICFIAAALAHEKSYEDIAGDHGILTKVLLQGLDCRHQERVNNHDLASFVEKKLKTETQTPIIVNLGRAIDLTFNRKTAPEIITAPTDAPCPYKGLFYFDCNETDALNFYGRDTLISELIEKIRHDNFIAVLGASGSGKSSLVRAGLLYRLQTGQHINGSQHWQHRIFTPNEKPLESLAWAFVDKTQSQINQAQELKTALDLLNTPDGFQTLIKAANTKVIVCVDQFEELFTLCRDDKQREQFLDLLLNTLPIMPEQYALIITLRADFFAQCTERDYFGLAKLIQQHLLAVTPLTEQELRDAIALPAQKHGVDCEAALLEQIIKDSENAVGYLPLLQDVLQTLWQQGLTLNNYVKVGGLYGALEQRANDVYDHHLTAEQQSVAQAVFLSLVKLGEGTQDTRRRALKSELLTARCPENLLNPVLHTLANQRLIVTSALSARDAMQFVHETVLDIAHEALIQHWQALRQWLNDNREFKAWRDRIEQAEKDYQAALHDAELLLRGSRLVEAEERLKQHHEQLNARELAYIQASIDVRQKEQREKTKRRRLWLGSLCGFSLLASVLAGLSYWQYQQAEQQKQRTEQQKKIALDVINQFTYDIPEALANIPKTLNITAAILQYNIQALDKIYALNPNDKTAQWEQAINYERVGDLYLNLLGDVDKASDYHQKSFNIRQKIAQQDPSNSAAQWNLSVSFEKLGDIHRSLNQTDKALAYYQQSFDIFQKIAQQDPSNSAEQRSLSISFEKLGYIHQSLNQTDKALSDYQQALEISQKIAQQYPTNSAAQRDLSASFNKLGDIHLSLNQTDKALSDYQQALNIRQKIAEQDPSNANAQRDLAVSYTELGNLNRHTNKTKTALEFFNKALTIAERLAKDKLNYQAQQDLKAVQDDIASVSKQQH